MPLTTYDSRLERCPTQEGPHEITKDSESLNLCPLVNQFRQTELFFPPGEATLHSSYTKKPDNTHPNTCDEVIIPVVRV